MNNTPAPHTATAQDVLSFWFADGLQHGWPSTSLNDLWFGGSAAQDEHIRQRFGPLVAEALNGGLSDWETSISTRLALIVVLDQFTRNVHRGQARAFAGDPRAQQLVLHTLAQGQDTALPTVGRVFLYMPLMHAENLALQDECVARFTQLGQTAPPELRDTLAGNLRFAQQHRDIVAQHGRFPYRNAALGRETTPEETEFLKNGPRFGQ
ncbi:MAG: DUF924 family protein [Hydrogenophaga sp.]|uniref:DUF924 family protein n=1 Tax=Hydrogenophaga sp. TaxID=1904254 RepID=UPI002779D254|nr:DUF924 family protein [Hydrogenophaga sp.]MDP2416589.1 DUF924 family protein [Hydrogenophaga sp.]MDZ4188153.1 DUF924 family protein [Hydrogenophaga sp.]